ncbi:MAG: PhnD/SsuA/transferrin family substrate-binding protein [Rhizobiales bacterium]|nr:PhnD/SsuA/transferrin family substrate-binding protein [Hyphomicrobiales bacterium]
MRGNRRLAFVSTLFAAALAVGGPAAAKDKLTFTYNTDPSHDAAVWAIANGKVKSDILDIELKPLNIPAAQQAMATKQFDVYENGLLALEYAAAQGLQMKMIGIELRYQPAPVGFGIWVKKDSPIKTVQDLKGKKIAVGGLRSTVLTVIRLAMQKKYGVNVALDGGDFNFVQVPGPGMLPALQTGRVDAAALSHIQSWQARKGEDYRMLINSGEDLKEVFGFRVITTVLMGYKDRVEANPKLYREFLRMLKESSDYVKKNPKEVFTALAAKAKIDPAFFEDWFANYSEIPISISDQDIQTINRIWEMARQIGMSKNPGDVRDWIWEGAIRE